MILKDVYESLKAKGIVKSQRQFAHEFCCCNHNYIATMTHAKGGPSVAVLLMLHHNLLGNHEHTLAMQVHDAIQEILEKRKNK